MMLLERLFDDLPVKHRPGLNSFRLAGLEALSPVPGRLRARRNRSLVGNLLFAGPVICWDMSWSWFALLK